MLVLDASVYVATVSETDRHHEISLRWLDARIRDGEHLVAPNLIEVEVAAATRRLSGSQEFADRVIDRMRERGFIELIPLTQDRARRAVEVATRSGVRGADAVYLALAQELAAPLITLDRQQLQRGSGVAAVRRPWTDQVET